MMTKRPTKKGVPLLGRMAFAAIQNDVKAALDRGEWQRSIYDSYGGSLPFTYSQFNRHVQRVFGKKATGGEAVPAPPAIVPPPPPPDFAPRAPRPPEPLQQVGDDRPKRFKMTPKRDDELF